MKLFANIREFYFGGGYYPFFFVGDEINVAFMLGVTEINKVIDEKDCFLNHLEFNEYEFLGTITNCHDHVCDKKVFIVKINNLYTFFDSNYNYNIGDRIYGKASILIDPGGFVETSEEFDFLYKNFKILNIRKVIYKNELERYNHKLSRLFEQKKISLENVNNTMGDHFVNYILELNSDGVEEKIIYRTITD